MKSPRIAISPTTETLSLEEGYLKVIHNDDGEYVGTFPEYEVKLQKDGRDISLMPMKRQEFKLADFKRNQIVKI